MSVYVAARDIPAGTSGADAARRGMLEQTEVVRRSVVPGAISKPGQLDGLVATQTDLRRRAGDDAPLRLAGGARHPRAADRRPAGNLQSLAMATSCSSAPSKDGDRVDVVASWAYPEGSQTHYSRDHPP